MCEGSQRAGWKGFQDIEAILQERRNSSNQPAAGSSKMETILMVDQMVEGG